MKEPTEGGTERRTTPVTQKSLQSPYAGWFQARQLYDEMERLLALPPASAEVVNRWRRNRIWQIEQRVRELHKRNSNRGV